MILLDIVGHLAHECGVDLLEPAEGVLQASSTCSWPACHRSSSAPWLGQLLPAHLHHLARQIELLPLHLN